MLVDNDVYVNKYVADGSTASFPIAFPFLEASHIEVYTRGEDVEDIPIDPSMYTITGAGVEAGGELTFNTTPVAGTVIAIIRNVPITQLYAYTELDNFPAESHENALAKLTMIDQQQAEILSRAVLVPVTSNKTSEQLIAEIFQAHDDARGYASDAASSAQDASDAATAAENTLQDVIDAGDAAVDAVEDEGDTQAERLEQIAGTIIAQATQLYKVATITLNSDIASESIINTPTVNGLVLSYIVGKDMLGISYNGTELYKDLQYEEVGNEGTASYRIKTLMPMYAGDQLCFKIMSAIVDSIIADPLQPDGTSIQIDANGKLSVVLTDQAITQAIGYTAANDSNVVKLSGDQTVGGTKTFSGPLIITDDFISIRRSNKTGGLRLTGGNSASASDGSFLTLFGAEDSQCPGYFRIYASTGAETRTLLEGRPSGKLTWDGKDILRISESGTGYMRFSNGLQICWGSATISTASTGLAVTFPKAFSATPNITFGLRPGNASSKLYNVLAYPRSSTGFTVYANDADGRMAAATSYIAIGSWS